MYTFQDKCEVFLQMDPKPTEDVFYKFEIPYPKRESLPDADIKKSLAMNIVDDQNQQATNPQVSFYRIFLHVWFLLLTWSS